MRTLSIAIIGLRRLFRDRTGLFFVILFPIIITLLIGLTVFRQAAGSIELGLHNASSGELSRNLVAALEESTVLDVVDFPDRESLETAIRRDEVRAGVVIPAEYDDALRDGRAVQVTFIPSPRTSDSQAVQSTVASILTTQATTISAAVFATENMGGDFEINRALASHLQEGDISRVSVSGTTVGEAADQEFTGFSYPSASNLVLFTFITSMTAAGQLIESRRLGINRRMISTSTHPLAVMIGLAGGRFAIALFQGLFIFAAASLIFDVNWGSLAGAMALIFAFALVSTGMALFFGSVLRTQEQSFLGVPLGIGLGMLGGCMWPLEIVSPTMRTIGHFTPHAWAMDGFVALIGKGVGLGGIVQSLFVLAGFALGLFALSVRGFRRGLTH